MDARGAGIPGAWAVIVVAVVGAACFLAAVPPGQPYDEPSHWATVEFYGREARMPELGARGVTYEAQQGPTYYALTAIVVRPVEELFGQQPAFFVARGINVLLAGVAVALTFLLALALWPGRRGVALVAAAFVGLNPQLLAVAGSVQNDSLTIAVALWAALCAVRALEQRDGSLKRWAGIGALIGLATLTKALAAAELLALGAALLVAARPTRVVRVRAFVAATIAFLAVSGWWFVRNEVLYGDLTGHVGLGAAGVRFRPLELSGVSSIGSWLRSLVSYLWVPTEYFRNVFHAPTVLRGAAVVLTIGIAAVAVRTVTASPLRRHLAARARERAGIAFVAAWFSITFVAYAVITWSWELLSPRAALIALPGLAVLVCGAVGRLRGRTIPRVVAAATFAFVTVVSLFLLVKVRGIPSMPYWIRFRS